MSKYEREASKTIQSSSGEDVFFFLELGLAQFTLM